MFYPYRRKYLNRICFLFLRILLLEGRVTGTNHDLGTISERHASGCSIAYTCRTLRWDTWKSHKAVDRRSWGVSVRLQGGKPEAADETIGLQLYRINGEVTEVANTAAQLLRWHAELPKDSIPGIDATRLFLPAWKVRLFYPRCRVIEKWRG